MLNGIDVSSYDPATPNLTGDQFIFVKATEGVTYVNPEQGSQAQAGRNAGCVVGFYHYVTGNDSMQSQAQWFVDQCDSVAGDLLVIDWEETSVSCADKDAILQAVKSLRPHHRVLLYCNTDFWLNIDTTSFCEDGLWIADYSNPAGSPGIQHPWVFHQYSGSPQDLDVGNFTSLSALQSWATSA